MRWNRSLPLILGLAALVVTGGACGDDGGDAEAAVGTTAPPALTVDEYLAAGNASCAASNAEIGAVFADLTGPPDQATFDALVAAVSAQVDDLEVIEAPPELADDHDALVASVRRGLEQMEEQGVAFFDDPTDPFAEASVLAAEMGLTACAEA